MADEKQINTVAEPQTAPPLPENASAVRDKRVVPAGVVPRQAQGYVVAGLAVLILMAVMFSKNHPKPAAKDTAPAPLAASTDMNQQKIHELEQDLSADQRQSQLQAQAQRQNGLPMAAGATAAPGTLPPGVSPCCAVAAAVPAQPAEPPRDPIADAEKALAFKARFASNLVAPDDAASHPSAEPVSADANAPAHSVSLPQLHRCAGLHRR